MNENQITQYLSDQTQQATNWSFRELFRQLFTTPQFKPTIILVYMAVALCAWKSLPIKPTIDTLPAFTLSTLIYGTWKIGAAAVLFGIIPCGIVKLIFKESLAEYGLQRGILPRVLFSASILVPIMITIGFLSGMNPLFTNVYPLNPAVYWVSQSINWYFIHAILYVFLYYLAFEFFFRGFLLHGLSDSCGIVNALLIQAAAAAFFHFGHPNSELWSSFMGSLLWGFIALRNRSIISCWLQHSSLGIALDWGMIYFGK